MDCLVKNTPFMRTSSGWNTSQHFMQEILYKMSHEMYVRCPPTANFESSRKKFFVSPDMMKHLKNAYTFTLYRPNRDRTHTLTPRPDPTFIGIPVEVDARLESGTLKLNAVFPGSNLVMGVQQVIPMFELLELCGSNDNLYRIKSNLTIIVKSRVVLPPGFSPSELVALSSLREMISESDYRKYVVHGFILVTAESGRVYQIFRNRSHTKVWENGVVVEEVCVRISDHNMPATDNVIALKTILEHSEEEFHAIGNVYNMRKAA
jgi:hypothetical protein